MPDALYFEDFPLGEAVEYGGVDVSTADIIAFAREFAPSIGTDMYESDGWEEGLDDPRSLLRKTER